MFKRVIFLAAFAVSQAFAASSFTPHFNFELPSDGDTNWGNSYRSNWSISDSQLYILQSTIQGATASVAALNGVTGTVLGSYLNGLTSNVQTQLNGKEPTQTKGTISSTTAALTVTGGAASTVGPSVQIAVQTATSSLNGLLLASDWVTFNAKAPNTTAGSGTTGVLTSSDWTTFNAKQPNLGYTPVNKAGDTMTGTLQNLRFQSTSSSASLPSLDVSGNGGNGIYSGGTNIVAFSTNSTQAMTIGSNQKVTAVSTTDATNTSNGALNSAGGLGVAKTLFAATVNVTGLTASDAIVTDGANNLISSSTTAAELAFVHGVTSNIQTQINGIVTGTGFVKSAGDTMSGTLAETGTADSTSAATGSVHMAGGLGVGKNVFVGGSVISSLAISTSTANYNVAASDQMVVAGATATVNLPAATGKAGRIIQVKKDDSPLTSVITVAANGTDKIEGVTTTTLNTQFETLTLTSDGVSGWYILGRDYSRAWQSYTPTVSTGTWTSTQGWWRRIGDGIEGMVYANALSADGSGNYTWTLPAGMQADLSGNKGPSTTPTGFGTSNLTLGAPIGIASVNDQGVAWYMDGTSGSTASEARAFLSDATHVIVVVGSSSATNRHDVLRSGMTLSSVSASVQIHFWLPILGWN